MPQSALTAVERGQFMNLRPTSILCLTSSLLLAGLSRPVFPQNKNSNAAGEVQFELVGQVANPSATTSIQFGYRSLVNGVGNETIFNPGPQNETTAILTFYNDTFTERVINNGPMRIINRVGTTTIYLDTSPDGDFANPDSFRDGIPVQTSEHRHQVILDTVTGAFTTTFVNTITSSDYFRQGSQNVLLGKVGQKFRMTVIGHLNTPTPPVAHIAGFAVGDLKR
jgi:hypothetical protein